MTKKTNSHLGLERDELERELIRKDKMTVLSETLKIWDGQTGEEVATLHRTLAAVTAGQGARCLLLQGEPGIGKSTLMLQVSGMISRDRKVLYVSGEESVNQLKLRSERVKLAFNKFYIVNETDVTRIISYIKELWMNNYKKISLAF